MATWAPISTGLWVDALMPWLDDILAYLATEGVGTIGETLFKYRAPPNVQSCIVLIDYLSGEPVWTQDSSSPNHAPARFQVMARDTTGSTANTRALNAYTSLAKLINGSTLSGTRYLSVKPLQRPFMLGFDDNQRAMVVFNTEAILE